MAEYKSFHYLMHKEPEKIAPVFVQKPPPPKFKELYSPRPGADSSSSLRLIHKEEKSYWRTRDRVEYKLYESRENKVLVITCRNIESKEDFRTIFLDLQVLYFELEAKALGHRDGLDKLADKKISSDVSLDKATAEYVVSRLIIGKEPLPWPEFDTDGHIKVVEENVVDDAPSGQGSNPLPVESGEGNDKTPADAVVAVVVVAASAVAVAEVHKERMVTFSRLSNDVYTYIEIAKPAKLSLDNTEYTKLVSSAPSPPPSTGEDGAIAPTPENVGDGIAQPPADSTATTATAAATASANPTTTAPEATKKTVSKQAASPTTKSPTAAATKTTSQGSDTKPKGNSTAVSSNSKKKVAPSG